MMFACTYKHENDCLGYVLLTVSLDGFSVHCYRYLHCFPIGITLHIVGLSSPVRRERVNKYDINLQYIGPQYYIDIILNIYI